MTVISRIPWTYTRVWLCYTYYTLGNKVVTTPFEARKSTWIEFLCFQWAEIDMKCTCDCSPKKFDFNHGRIFISMASGVVKVQNRNLGGRIPKSVSHCVKFELTIAYFSQFSKTTPRRDRALVRLVRHVCFISTQALKAQMRHFYGMGAGRKAINNSPLSHGYRTYRPARKPLLTANQHSLHLEWAQRLQYLTMSHWQHVIFGDESRFQLNLVDGRLRIHYLSGECSQEKLPGL